MFANLKQSYLFPAYLQSIRQSYTLKVAVSKRNNRKL